MKITNIWNLIAALFVALCLALLCVSTFTGCQAAREWAAENPGKANLVKAGLLIGLNSAADKYTLVAENDTALRAAIDLALDQAATAEEAAAILDAQTLDILDDADVRDALLAAWQAQLRERADETPAAGPETDYARDLADALEKAVERDEGGDLRPEKGNTPTSDLRSPTSDPSHWSDPLWSATSWFSGCDSYAAFKAFHAAPPSETELDESLRRQAEVGGPSAEYTAWARQAR